MTTVINTPGGQSDSGFGSVLGVILAIALVVLFFVYALPALRGNDKPATNAVTIPLPSTDSSNNGSSN